MPEVLHALLKEFWDHDVQWCLNIVGAEEVDFRFVLLQPTAGCHHFKEGISKLKQVTGHVHRDVQHYIMGIIGSTAPPEVITAVRALMDFRYRVQAYRINNADIDLISAALNDFHSHKHAIIEHGRRLSKGKKVIDNWYILKLELMQSIAPSIKHVRVTIQWSPDVMEHAHISEIKTPARSTNNNNYDPQICCYLDRAEKCRGFELATSLRARETCQEEDALSDDRRSEEEGSTNSSDEDDEDDIIQVPQTSDLARPTTDYFAISARLCTKQVGSIPHPLHTFVVGSTAMNLSYTPSLRRISVDKAAQKFRLPDL